jgi:hypothetical protein
MGISQMLLGLGGAVAGALNPIFVSSGALALYSEAVSPNSVTTGLVIASTGEITLTTATIVTVQSGTRQTGWWLPTGAAPGTSYWVRRVLVSGSLSGSDPGSGWLSLSSSRTYSILRSTNGTSTCVLYFEIASDSAGTTIVGTSGNVTLTAYRDSGA